MSRSTTDDAEEATRPRRGGRIKMLIVIALLAVAGGGGYLFMQGQGGGGEPEQAQAPAPEPGAVVALDSIYVNLAEGRYLKIGVALQSVAHAEGEPAGHGGADGAALDGSMALDAVIDHFSGRTVASLSSSTERNEVKAALLEDLRKRYHDEVMDVYFTEFVMQ